MGSELNLLLHLLDDTVGNDTRHMVYVGTTLCSTDTVDERDLFKTIITRGDADSPVFTRSHDDIFTLGVHLRVDVEGALGEDFTLKLHLAVGRGTHVRIVHTLFKNLINVIINRRHAKQVPFRGERNAHRGSCRGVRRNFRGVTGAHVVGPLLGVFFFVFSIFDRHDKLCGIYIGKFCPVTVATPHDSLLVVIIVGAREKMTKSEFGVPQTLLLVHLHRDATQRTVILHTDHTSITVDRH